MLKFAAIVLAVFSALSSAYLWAQVLPSQTSSIKELKQEIEDNTIYCHTIDVGEFSYSSAGSTLTQHYYFRVYNHSKTAFTQLSDITGQNIYYCDYNAISSGSVSIECAYVSISSAKLHIYHNGNISNSTITNISDTITKF